jgi:ATP phosphoribosyltransferase regulatory subunit HisZ
MSASANPIKAAMADTKLSNEQQVLLRELYVPAFVQKCAELGLPINDEAALNEAMETAALVKLALANKNQSVVKQANASLKTMLGLHEVEAKEAKTATQVKQASSLGANPRVREAVAALLSKKSA